MAVMWHPWDNSHAGWAKFVRRKGLIFSVDFQVLNYYMKMKNSGNTWIYDEPELGESKKSRIWTQKKIFDIGIRLKTNTDGKDLRRIFLTTYLID